MSEKKKILIVDKFSSEAYLTLHQQSFFNVEKTAFIDLFDVDLSGVHGLIIRSRTPITEDILKRSKQLQVLVTATSGFDHIDLKACEKWGITAMHTPNANIESAAQLTWGLVLSCANKINNAYKTLKAGEWNREFLIGTELAGKTFGVVGLGRIGKRVAEIADTFNMKVLAYDPYVDDHTFQESMALRVSYDEILKSSDVLSFHVPRTKETEYMLKRTHFDYLNRGAILINTSRGGVIHEGDLCEAIENGWLSAVGLDVFEKEPLPKSSKLLNYPQVVLTPHLGANTHEAFAKASEQAALKVIRFFIDGTTSDTLPPKAPWYGAAPAFS